MAFYSLQVGPGAAALAEWRGPAPIHDLGPQLTDWGATAAAISQLDLVVAVDTGVVHLAGALGVPAWVLLCYAPDWRWLLDRADSPWYPAARLFRQPRPKDWASVMAEAAAALRVFHVALSGAGSVSHPASTVLWKDYAEKTHRHRGI